MRDEVKTWTIEYQEIGGRIYETSVDAWDESSSRLQFIRDNPGATIRGCWQKRISERENANQFGGKGSRNSSASLTSQHNATGPTRH